MTLEHFYIGLGIYFAIIFIHGAYRVGIEEGYNTYTNYHAPKVNVVHCDHRFERYSTQTIAAHPVSDGMRQFIQHKLRSELAISLPVRFKERRDRWDERQEMTKITATILVAEDTHERDLL